MQHPGSQSLRILVVEDNTIDQLYAISLLKSIGHYAVAVQNGVDALKIVPTEHFDLILMDLTMPEMDGFEATVQLKRQPFFTTPIIALTGSPDPTVAKKCYHVGMDGFIPKPLTTDSLRGALAPILSRILVNHGSTR